MQRFDEKDGGRKMIATARDIRDYEFDPALKYMHEFRENVYQVQKDGQLYILKAPRDLRRAGAPVEGLNREIEALRRAEGIDGVARLVQQYDSDGMPAILKTYFDGQCMMDTQGFRLTRDMYIQLMDITKMMHGRGVAYLDLHSENILVSPDGQVGLTDFDVCDIRGQISERKFEMRKNDDLERLRYLAKDFNGGIQ